MSETNRKQFRALSWWVAWEDLELGNPALSDRIRRRADAFAEDLADEVIVRGRVDFVQWVRPSGGTVRKPGPYDRGGERDADDGTDRQCDVG